MAMKVSTDPVTLLKSLCAAGQLTTMSASDVVSVGGKIYVIVALKTASAGAAPAFTEPVCVAFIVKYSVSGVFTAAQWPFSENCFDCCPGGSRVAAPRSVAISEMISLAVVCPVLVR